MARERLLALLADGGWHTRTEVAAAGIHYPDAWVRVLRDNGCHVDVTEQGLRLVGDVLVHGRSDWKTQGQPLPKR